MVLMRKVETWRCSTEKEAEALIERMTEETKGTLSKKSIELKQKKSKGQVIAENYKVTMQFDFAGQWDEEE